MVGLSGEAFLGCQIKNHPSSYTEILVVCTPYTGNTSLAGGGIY